MPDAPTPAEQDESEEAAAKRRRLETHGWFATPGRPGDRTLKQQIRGLGPLTAAIAGRSVLDVGCAEGLLALYLAGKGAVVHGIEIVPGHVDIANSLKGDAACIFETADANSYAPMGNYDVVLLLAVLHKLRDPSGACRRIAACAMRLCVIRFPSSAVNGVITDQRSNWAPHDIPRVMGGIGFALERVESGPMREPTYYFRR